MKKLILIFALVLNLNSFAQTVVEHGSGWSITLDKDIYSINYVMESDGFKLSLPVIVIGTIEDVKEVVKESHKLFNSTRGGRKILSNGMVLEKGYVWCKLFQSDDKESDFREISMKYLKALKRISK